MGWFGNKEGSQQPQQGTAKKAEDATGYSLVPPPTTEKDMQLLKRSKSSPATDHLAAVMGVSQTAVEEVDKEAEIDAKLAADERLHVGASGTEYRFYDEDHVDTLETPLRYFAYSGRLSAVVRLTAYASEAGEAARPLVSVSGVRAAYGVTWAYIAGDVAYDTYLARTKYQLEGGDLAVHCAERFTFHALASVLLPAYAMRGIVGQAQNVFAHAGGLLLRYGPSAIGLSMIPFFPMVLDEATEHMVSAGFNMVFPRHRRVVHHSGQIHD